MHGLTATGPPISRVLVAHRRRMHRPSPHADRRPHPHTPGTDPRTKPHAHPASSLVPFVYASGTFHYVGDPVAARQHTGVRPAFQITGTDRGPATSVDLGL